MSLLQSDKGFTLVEAMVALAILAAGMAGVGTMLFEAYSQNIRSLSDRNMYQVAIDIAEDIKSQVAPRVNWSEVESINLNNPDSPAPKIYTVDYQQSGQDGSGNNFTVRRGMRDRFVYKWVLSDGHTSGTLRLRVTVAWDNVPTAATPATQDPDDPRYWRFKSLIGSFIYWQRP